jgi:hypothetical protein
MIPPTVAREPHQLVSEAITDTSLHPEILLLLSKQLHDKGKPWDGCFGANPVGPTAWRDGWDPNSRVLVSLLLCIGLQYQAWPSSIRDQVSTAALYAIRSELEQNRVPETYTNVAVSLAASCIYLGNYFSDADLYAYGQTLIEKVTALRTKLGGFHEFASPTYLGLSLLSASFAEQITENQTQLVNQLSSDLVRNWDSSINDFTGVSMRSYGPSVHTHYSLSLLALKPYLELNSYNPPNHLFDKSFEGVFNILKPFNPERVTDRNPHSTSIPGVVAITSASHSNIFHLEAATYAPNTWHHQAVSASLHVPGAALTLRHPSVSAAVEGTRLHWHRHSTLESGNPDWLWGGLQRPDTKLKPQDTPLLVEGYNLKLIDSKHIQLGQVTLEANPPLLTSGSTLTLNSEEGSLTVL